MTEAVTIPSPSSENTNSVVKSAGRTLQILEFFDSVQREACVSEISRALQYPQSSTSVLLRSLVAMGYLLHDQHQRSYYPTHRVSLLGNWVDPALIKQGDLLARADELARTTGQTVVLARSNGLSAQYIHISRQSNVKLPQTAAAIGILRPLATTAVGKALLSVLDENYVSRLVRRLNSERDKGISAIDTQMLIAELKMAQKRGYTIGLDAAGEHSAIAVVLRRARHLVAVGIEAVSEFIEDVEHFAPDLQKLIKASNLGEN